MPRRPKVPPVTTTNDPATLLFDDLGYLREPTVLKLLPISRSSWRRGIREGIYPAPVKLGSRASAWRVSQIRRLLASFSESTTPR